MDSEIFEKAMAVINKRRNTAFAENERRIEEINKKIPEIREVNDTIFNSGKELIRMFSENKTQDAAIRAQQLKKYNMGAQAMSRQMLVQHGYPADYLDVHYTCQKCKDTGYNNSEYCECLRKLFGQFAAERINAHTHLNLSSFDTFSLSYYKDEAYGMMVKILNYTQDYAYNFTTGSPNVFLFGDTGLGKTHLSLAIANEVIKKGYTVIYDSAVNILQTIQKEQYSYEHSADMIKSVNDVDLLILDDLGTEYQTQFFTSTVYNIINPRLNRSLPTIISTNLDYYDLSERYNDRVASRIITNYTILQFAGEDIRFMKKQQQQKDKPF